MTEIVSSTVARIFEYSAIYEMFQGMVGASACHKRFVKEFIRPVPGTRILDIGCGPADILRFLPAAVEYVGYDPNPKYIACAQKKYKGRGQVFCAGVGKGFVPPLGGQFDVVLAMAVLHHLEDKEAADLFEGAYDWLKDGGVLLTFDAVYVPNQSSVAKWIISHDRGRYVRTPEEYMALCSSRFASIETYIFTNMLGIPYTHIVMKCSKPPAHEAVAERLGGEPRKTVRRSEYAESHAAESCEPSRTSPLTLRAAEPPADIPSAPRKSVQIADILKNLKLLEEGIWISDNRPRVSYPEKRDGYCFRIEDQSFWFRHRNNCLVEVLRRFPPGGTLYDVGGGNGYVTLGLRTRGIDSILVEPRIEAVRNAKARGVAPIICSTLEDAGFKEQTVPAVGLFDVLEHIEDDVAYLKNLKRLLVEGGRLYVTVPACNTLWSADDVAAHHYRRYALITLRRTLRAIGYEIDYTTHFFCFLPLAIFLFRTIPSRMGIRRQEVHEGELNPGVPRGLLQWYMDRELARIRKSRIHFGASCLIVARARA